jgi:hypothetical protein
MAATLLLSELAPPLAANRFHCHGRFAVPDDIDALIDEVSGEEFVGAARRGQPVARARSAPMARSERSVEKRAPLGFGNYTLAAGASTTLTARVQRSFHPDRLLCTSSQLGALITSIKVGDEEQLLGGSVPAELYGTAALADPRSDDFTPSQGGIDFSITISNSAATSTSGAVGMKGLIKR